MSDASRLALDLLLCPPQSSTRAYLSADSHQGIPAACAESTTTRSFGAHSELNVLHTLSPERFRLQGIPSSDFYQHTRRTIDIPRNKRHDEPRCSSVPSTFYRVPTVCGRLLQQPDTPFGADVPLYFFTDVVVLRAEQQQQQCAHGQVHLLLLLDDDAVGRAEDRKMDACERRYVPDMVPPIRACTSMTTQRRSTATCSVPSLARGASFSLPFLLLLRPVLV